MKNIFHSTIIFFFCLTSYVLCLTSQAYAGPGDTIKVQTFTFGSPQDGWFVMPSDTFRFSKIYMNYTLKCNPNQNPACGEWDYLTYTNLYQPSIDSFIKDAHNYQVNGLSPDSFSYIKTSTYQLHPYFQKFIVNTDTISYSNGIIGNGTTTSSFPFKTSSPISKTQYLWTADELSAQGLFAGNITGIQLNILSSGGLMKNLFVGMKNSSLDSLTADVNENSGFTTNYQSNISFINSGWNSIAFTVPFYWDGTSNVVVEVTYDNMIAATDYSIASDVANWKSSINTSGADYNAHFDDGNYISVPKEAFEKVDSQITIAFWLKGDNFLQDRTTFEAYNDYDQRVLNVHLPWSDGNIYWDAGCQLIGGFDRIYKASNVNDYENNWHYWAFTKNVGDGNMKIYRDGSLWHIGTGLFKTMKDVKTFWIGSALWASSVSANANMDEFTVWNAEVDSNTLKAYMYKDVDDNHPFKNNLQVYYQFDDDAFVVSDVSGNNFDGSIIGAQINLNEASEMNRNFKNITDRAQINLEQGVYTSHLDSTLVFDTIWNTPQTLVLFNDLANPQIATDTQLVWLPFNQIIYNNNGDSTGIIAVVADTTIHLITTPYNTGAVPTLKRFELARYITPYGINLSLGDGFTWTFDVSDYATLLHDSVYLSAGNWQELLDMQFIFIEGTPPRDPISIQNLWQGNYGWYANTNADLAPKEIYLDSKALNSRVKLRITGHGADNNNCAEFCENTAFLKVDGIQKFQRDIWRNDCALNPVYPQGGTWIFQRANWCPGAEVTTYDWELSPFVTAGDSAQLDLDLDYYSGSGGANYVTESQLVSYSAPNFSLDAEVYDIFSPTNTQVYKRRNPVCNNPLIAVRNDGSTTLTSFAITYGIEGATPSVFYWNGNLAFLDTVHIRLGAIFSPGGSGSDQFTATVSNPNGGVDENPINDAAISHFNFPPQYPAHIYVELKTNHHGSDNDYTISDDAGNIILSKSNLDDDTNYKDTMWLADGCYTFKLNDSNEDGLYFWFYGSYGSGYCRIKNADNGTLIKSFGTDFGKEIYQQFTVGYFVNTEDVAQVKTSTLNVYPNPTDGVVWADVYFAERKDAEVFVLDLQGKIVYHQSLKNVLSNGLTIDLTNQPAGMYVMEVKT
ncbi:MAG: T9SS type A sorting domain-containing protein, partial [Chitinophagales bacterium]|nr:T9SS type A sorting domain-containing protein [Chitinophagales bacterium]